MRVIAGQAKGTRLAPVPEGTRPMTDRAREGLYSSLGDRVIDARVLDLYAGTGAVGIEALSRGASRATFVDRGADAITAVLENLRRTKFEDRADLRRSAVLPYLRGPAAPADLVLVDAPYGLEPEEVDGVFAALHRGWLAPEGDWTVMLSRPRKGYTPGTPIDWQAAKLLNYGDTLIHLYREI